MMLYLSLLYLILFIIISNVVSDEEEVVDILKKRMSSLDQYIIKKPHNNCNLSKFVKITEIPYGRRYKIILLLNYYSFFH